MERFHRQLKAAIICHDNSNWVESLPFVLLGIRSAYKEDLGTSTAELLYGEPLRLPGEFFEPEDEGTVDLTDYMSRLRCFVHRLQPSPASRHGKGRNTFVYKDLATCTHVFLRDCTVGGSLKSAYTGPHKVIQRGDKTYKILMNNKEVTVSIDRVKPAFILRDPDNHLSHSHPTYSHTPNTHTDRHDLLNPQDNFVRTTKSGRTVRFPDYYRP